MEKKKRFYSILTKIRIAFLLLFAVFLLIIMYIMGVQYKKRSIEEINNQIRYEDELVAQAIEERMQNTNRTINMIIVYLNEFLPSAEWIENGGPSITKENRKIIYKCMLDTFTTLYNTEQIMVLWNNGVTWYENWVENYSMQYGGEPLLSELEEFGVDKNGSWLTKLSSESQIQGTGCYYAKQYVDIQTGENLGYVVLKLRKLLESVDKKNMEREIYLFDETGDLIQSSDRETVLGHYECQDLKSRLLYSNELRDTLLNMESGKERIIHCVQFGSRWELITVNDISQKMAELKHSINLILFVSVALMIVIYFVTFRIIKRVLYPVSRLSAHMDKFKEQLPVPIALQAQNDEAGVLIHHFNKMAKRNAELVDMLLREKKQQEQLKLSLLQAQIKPHFLYNTLDTIYCLVIMGKNEEGSRMTKLLSMYYRHVLSRGMDWVLLSEEVQQTENYLQIQKIRYRDKLEFTIHVDEKVENIKIPKLTLQPLVENAIYHGIKPSGRKGMLSICITQEADTIFILVRDDGVGFSREKFEECVKSDYCTEGFGLKNVVDRLGIYYKERCQVRLEACDKGTSLLIEIKISE